MAELSGPLPSKGDRKKKKTNVNPWLPNPEAKEAGVKKKFPRYFDAAVPDVTSQTEKLGSEQTHLDGNDNFGNAHGDLQSASGQTTTRSSSRKKNWPEDNGDKQQNKVDWKYEKYVKTLRNKLKPNEGNADAPRVTVANLNKQSYHRHELLSKLKKGGELRPGRYPGDAPIDPKRLLRHSRGEGPGTDVVRSSFHESALRRREAIIEDAVKQAARVEVMLTENEGYLEADEGEKTNEFSQSQIAAAVDITTATKFFNLELDHFGPYRMDYNRSGRHLLLGGRKGHVAAIDWPTKKLHCEINVMEEVFDVKWLHVETMFAVAQRKAVFIYDNTGTELHHLKVLNHVLRLEFLPYHFLLATAGERGWLNWLDISIGKSVHKCNTHLGRLGIMAQNPENAVLCLGHSHGTVTMWTPSMVSPAVKMLCHSFPLTSLAIDHRGQYMATAATNREVRIWDLRMLKEVPLREYRLRSSATNLAISQRGLMAISMGNVVEVYRNCLSETADDAYLRHSSNWQAGNLQFCPYEDVLGVAHSKGFASLIVPGAGEPNFDGLEANPYQTKSQRKEAEVKALLEKIQPEFIRIDPATITEVYVPSVEENLAAAAKLSIFVPPKIDLSHRKGARGSAVKVAKTKQILHEEARMKFVKNRKAVEGKGRKGSKEVTEETTPTESSVLDRFQSKRKRKN